MKEHQEEGKRGSRRMKMKVDTKEEEAEYGWKEMKRGGDWERQHPSFVC